MEVTSLFLSMILIRRTIKWIFLSMVKMELFGRNLSVYTMHSVLFTCLRFNFITKLCTLAEMRG